MNFSAQGYALLNARLKPHIAVLEGGYAVESALPYVNVGIIMAMAGMDTSFVKEPNYDRDYKPQPADVTGYIERLVDQLKGLHLGDRLQRSPHAEGKIVERERGIFYDTDGIREKQNERIRTCKACAGALAIDSSSSLGKHILAVAIPRNACDDCRKTGLQWFEKGRTVPSIMSTCRTEAEGSMSFTAVGTNPRSEAASARREKVRYSQLSALSGQSRWERDWLNARPLKAASRQPPCPTCYRQEDGSRLKRPPPFCSVKH